MAYGIRDGDIIGLDDAKAGSLTMSVPLVNYTSGTDPAHLWATQPAIRTVTGEIAREVGSLPFNLYRRLDDDERERVTGTFLSRALRMPAPGIGSARWFEQVLLDLAVYDRWGALITFDDNGLGFRRLPAHRIAVAIHAGVRTGLWYFPLQGGEPVHLPLGKVVFDVAPSALINDEQTEYRGDSRLRTLSTLASELDAVGEWRAQVMRNGGRIPAVIERPVEAPKWDDAGFNRFKSDMSAYRQGGGNEGGFPILEDGMKLKAVDVFNPTDFDTADIRRLTLIEACLLYHYPPELLGARESTYSNIEAFREMKWVDVLGSWVINLEQALNVGLLASELMGEDEYIEANVDAKLRGSFEAEARSFQQATGRPWMTTNEARKKKNLGPVEGGDELVTPLNVLVGGIANPRDTAPDPDERDDARSRQAPKA